jgi:hypothetical protein
MLLDLSPSPTLTVGPITENVFWISGSSTFKLMDGSAFDACLVMATQYFFESQSGNGFAPF